MSRILIATVGSRGDVQPYVALGKGLVGAGHTVHMMTDRSFAPLVEGTGIHLVPIDTDPRRTFEEGLRQAGPHSMGLLRWLFRRMQHTVREYFIGALEASRQADLVLFSPLAFPAAHVAEALGLPFVGLYLQPSTPTRAFPNPFVPPLPRGCPFRGTYHWLSFRLFNWILAFTVRPVIDRCRREVLGLPPKPWRFYANVDLAEIPILYGFSPQVVPRPRDWGPWIHVTGYWFLEDPGHWQPPPELVRFLEAGPPPVYVGFGSMVDVEPADLSRTVLAALAETGQRAVLLGGWAGLGRSSLPDSVLRVEEVPHAWLFPRCAAVVHHGGAGTTAAGLRAGVPTVVVPFYFDQPFWGRRVHELGVGPAPIPRRRLTVERLARAIHRATGDPAIRERAQELGRRIRQEDGVAQALSVLASYLQ